MFVRKTLNGSGSILWLETLLRMNGECGGACIKWCLNYDGS